MDVSLWIWRHGRVNPEEREMDPRQLNSEGWEGADSIQTLRQMTPRVLPSMTIDALAVWPGHPSRHRRRPLWCLGTTRYCHQVRMNVSQVRAILRYPRPRACQMIYPRRGPHRKVVPLPAWSRMCGLRVSSWKPWEMIEEGVKRLGVRCWASCSKKSLKCAAPSAR
jgi:hypothetical protein